MSKQSFAPVMHDKKLVRSWKLRPNEQLSECTRRLFTWDFSRRLHPFAPNGSLARQLVNLLKRAQGRSAFVGTQPPTAASHIRAPLGGECFYLAACERMCERSEIMGMRIHQSHAANCKLLSCQMEISIAKRRRFWRECVRRRRITPNYCSLTAGAWIRN